MAHQDATPENANGAGEAAPLTTAQVLIEEAIAIHGAATVEQALDAERLRSIRSGAAVGPDIIREIYRALNGLGSAALCLSGGGIRSAAFSLGVMQALATHPRPLDEQKKLNARDHVGAPENSLLAQLHYLSTVSGGGYIGGWLSAWVKHAGFPKVWAGLVDKRDRPEHEAEPIAWLRSYSNFLTPQLGITSADSWAAVAVVVRNLVLNWLIVLPALCAVLIVLKLFAGGVAAFSQFDPQSCRPYAISLIVAAAVLLIASLAFTNRQRPTRGRSQAGQTQVLLRNLLPGVLAAILLTLVAASPCAETFVRNQMRLPFIPLPLVPALAAMGTALYGIAWVISRPRWRGPRDFFGDLLACLVAGAVFGALVATGLYLYVVHIPFWGLWPFEPQEVVLLVFGVPWVLTSYLLAEMIFVGLTSWEEGSDSDREWLARAAGWVLVTAIGWALLMLVVFVGSLLVESVYDQFTAWLVAGGAGSIVAWLGKSAATPATGAAKDRKEFWANLALALAGPVFFIALAIALSSLIDEVLFGEPLIHSRAFKATVPVAGFPGWPHAGALVIAFVVVGFVGTFASRYVNINRFSLHALYRNRLVRAFLGASNPDRATDRNVFTDFAESDHPQMHELWPKTHRTRAPGGANAEWRPFHVVNIALNIVSSKKLAWQERKAETFTVTPLHAGTACGGAAEAASAATAPGAFRSSRKYGGDDGISLGTAVAISGAAASPNMGYHSSPSLAILLTLLNVRLGWWLGNPGPHGRDTYAYEGPRTAIRPLLAEMFGQTTDDSPYVYLSDGGHFENLGLYEMVRRRCRYIVVVDAGCDENFQFEDLGNAVRKIRLDLGVDITFRGLGALRHRQQAGYRYLPKDPPFHALGTIHYSVADDACEDGTILYIKPAFHRDRLRNIGVANYAMCNPKFPHEPTGDQFFSESQFESYRALGFDIADDVLNQARTDRNLPEQPSCPALFTAIGKTLREFPDSESSPPRTPD